MRRMGLNKKALETKLILILIITMIVLLVLLFLSGKIITWINMLVRLLFG
jgi:hypothetical protein